MLYDRTGTGFVKDINCFVREKSVGDISCGKLNCIWYKVRGDVNAVVLFIFVYKTAEDTAGGRSGFDQAHLFSLSESVAP